MKSNLTKFALSASIMLAMALTFSCSSDDENNNNNGGGTSSGGGGGSSSPSGGGGVPFNENSQVYNRDGSIFTGSEVIQITKGKSCSDNVCQWKLKLEAGSVTNGIVNLQLPSNVPSEFVKDFSWEAEGCSGYEGIKTLDEVGFILTNSGGDYIGDLDIYYEDNEIGQTVEYWYFSKAGKITCYNEKSNRTINMNVTPGWNKIYRVSNNTPKRQEYNTNNILTKEVKWFFSVY